MSKIHRIHRRLSRVALGLWIVRSSSLSLWVLSLAWLCTLFLAYLVLNGWRGDTVLWLFMALGVTTIVLPLVYMIYQGIKLANHHYIAQFIEQKTPALNDALLTVISAEKDPSLGSIEVIEALQEDVAKKLEDPNFSKPVSLRQLQKAVYVLLLSITITGISYYQDGGAVLKVFKLLQEEPEQLTQRLAYTPLIGDIKLTIIPPKYTGLGPRFIEGGNGEFEALKGSEVILEAILSREAQKAQLWFKYPEISEQNQAVEHKLQDDQVQDGLAPVAEPKSPKKQSQTTKVLDFKLEQRRVEAKFVLNDHLKWNVSLVDQKGTVWREAVERNVRLKFDQAPSIKIVNPISGERVDPAKDLKVSLEAKDDFGLKSASIFVALAADMEHPEELPLNGVKGKKWQVDDLVDLRVVQAQGGDRIALWAEVYDQSHDEGGPQHASSEVIYLEVDSPEWAHRKLLDQLREHLEVQIEALASRLELAYQESNADTLTVSKVLSNWIEARQKSQSAQEGFEALLKLVAEDPLTPKEIYLTLTNHLMKLEDSMATEERVMNQTMSRQNKAPLKAQIQSIQLKSSAVEEAHEGVIIIIEAMVARMALEQMSQLADELKQSRANIKELMNMYKENPSDSLKDRIRRELQRFKQKMKAMRELMKRLKQKLPEEFLNLDGMKNDEVVDSLKESETQVSSIEQLLEDGKIDEALKALDELSNSLEEMSQQLQEDVEELHRQSNPELEKALSELMDSTRDLMKSQEELKKDTQAQQAAMDKAVEEGLKKADKKLEAIKAKVQRIKSIESKLKLTRQGRYIDRLRADAQKAVNDLERAIEQIMFEEGVGAALRSEREFDNLKRIESNPYRRRKQAGPSPVEQELNEASRLSAEVAEELEELKQSLEIQASNAQELEVQKQEEARKKRQEQAEKEAQQAQASQPSQGQPSQGQPSQGQPSQGQPSQGQPSQGQPSQGQPSQGQPSQGQPSQGQGLAERQSGISKRLQKLQSRLKERQQKIPSLNQGPSEPFEQAQKGSQEAAKQLGQGNPGRGVEGQQQVSEALKQVMQGLQQSKKPQKGQQPGQDQQQGGQKQSGQHGGPSTKRVEVPKQDGRGPDAMRKKLLDAMKSKSAQGYDDQVKAYYDSLVK